MEIVLHLPTAPVLAVAGFDRGSAFPGPAVVSALPELARAARERSDTRLLLFGHADSTGTEAQNKALTDLRAQAVLALLTHDPALFDSVARQDHWARPQYETMLRALDAVPQSAELTDDIAKRTLMRFQQTYNGDGYHYQSVRARTHPDLQCDGVLGTTTEAALRDAYLGRYAANLDPDRFFGPKFAGCAAFNRGESPEQDRRVTLALYRPDFPTESRIPCREGDVTACKINRRAKHAWKCNFYRRTLEAETQVQGAPAGSCTGLLQSLVARDQLASLAERHGEDLCTRWLTSVFGADIPADRYAELYTRVRDETLPHPPIVLVDEATVNGHPGAYNRQEQRIEIAQAVALSAVAGEPDATWLLLAVLVEEFGHYLDDWLRRGHGDATFDEGARFGYMIVALDPSRDMPQEFAQYTDAAGIEHLLAVDWSELEQRLRHIFHQEAQLSDEYDGAREYFGPALAADRLRAGAELAMTSSVGDRVAMMNRLGTRFGIPIGAWTTGQSRLFVSGDVRIAALLRELSNEKASRAAAVNLGRAQRHTGMDPYLILTTAARENARSVTAQGNNMIDTWREGGLDFLWKNRDRLGLPKSVTKNWKQVSPFRSPETGNIVEPGLIPARDQVLGYAAQTRMSFEYFERHVRDTLGMPGTAALSTLSLDARAVWQAYAFLAPGGSPFDPSAGVRHGQMFGVKSAFGYLLDKATKAGRAVDLNEVVTDASLDGTDYVRIAKARAVEAAFVAQYVSSLLTSTATTGTGVRP